MSADDGSLGVSPLLELEGVTAGYKATTVLDGIDLTVPVGGIVAVLGPNGAGKTTLLRTISGLIAPTRGSVRFAGVDIAGWKPERVVSAGVSHAPEGRRMFPYLSTEANLRMGAYTRRDRRQVETEINEMLDRFEVIGRRRSTPANLLSGGEQQLVCLLRAIIAKPKLLLLDEPSLGLAPALINLTYEVISELAAERNVSLLVVEQNARHALDIASTAYVIVGGRIAHFGPASDLDAASVAEMYFTHGAPGSKNPEASAQR